MSLNKAQTKQHAKACELLREFLDDKRSQSDDDRDPNTTRGEMPSSAATSLTVRWWAAPAWPVPLVSA